MELNEALIVLDLEAGDARSVIDVLAGILHDRGFVSRDYGERTFERELKHPTGLPTSPFCIAFPHADADGVNQSALAVASLRKPVVFQNMGDPEEALDVLMVFMLANNSPGEQIQALRNLATLFSQPKRLVELRELPTPERAATWLRRELGLC